MPSYWEILGLIFGGLGVIGFLMSLPTFLHHTYGQPRLKVELVDSSPVHNGRALRALVVLVENTRVRNALVRLGVTRLPVESLAAWIEIRESGSGAIVLPRRVARLGDLDSRKTRVRLPGATGTALVAVYADSFSGKVHVEDDRSLDHGQYKLGLELIADGQSYCCTADFVVSATPPHLYWSDVRRPIALRGIGRRSEAR